LYIGRPPLANEAADAIEALQAEVEMWKATSNAVIDMEKVQLRLERDALRRQLADIPTEVTEVAQIAIAAMLKEYNYPANPSNAARAGWRACRLYLTSIKEVK
jgi:regulator of replication initiation timing